MNDQLRTLYRENWDIFSKAMEKGSSAPLLLSATEDYRQVETRLFFVGQETRGWDHPEESDDPIGDLMQRYESFRFGKTLRHTPFFQAVHEIRENVNLGSSDASIMWSNLSKVDVEEDLPPEEVLGPILRAGILPREIEITEPDAVIFFTGPTPEYDRAFHRTFAGAELTEVESDLDKISHPDLPELSFRTYHPGYLRRGSRWKLVQSLAKRVQST